MRSVLAARHVALACLWLLGTGLAGPFHAADANPKHATKPNAHGFSAIQQGRQQALTKREPLKPRVGRLGGKKGASSAERSRYYALKLAKAGIGKRAMAKAAKHVELGAPSAANATNPTDLLLARNEYVVSYNVNTNTPNWVAFHMEASDLGQAARPNKIRRDPTLPHEWAGASDKDYKGSGFTRGHMADAGARSATYQSIRKTFVMTNVVPQLYENNAGPWNDLETHLRDQVLNKGQEVSVYTGPIYDNPQPKRIGSHKVAVPTATWKIAVIRPRGASMDSLTEATRIVSVIVPNTKGAVTIADTFDKFRVAPQEIEARTGLTFLTNLEPQLRAKLMTKVDDVAITEHFAKSYKMGDLRKHYGGQVPAYWIEKN